MRAWPILIVALALSILIAACAGHDWATPADLFRAIAGAADLRSRLLVEWRIPRVLAAALVGALLGLGGTVFQGVFRNPLAEPYLLGSAGGAALGATVALLVPLAAPQSFVLPVLAFVGAWGATMLVVGPNSLYLIRFLVGVLEAGFVPGVEGFPPRQLHRTTRRTGCFSAPSRAWSPPAYFSGGQ